MIDGLSKIGLNKKTLVELEDAKLNGPIIFNNKENKAIFDIKVNKLLSFDSYLDLLEKLNNSLNLNVQLKITGQETTLAEDFDKYFTFFINQFPISSLDFTITNLGNSYSIEVYQESSVRVLEEYNNQLINLLSGVGSDDSFSFEVVKIVEEIQVSSNYSKPKLKVNPKNYRKMKISNIDNEKQNVMIKGFIYDLDDTRITKKGNNFTNFNIIDDGETMPATVFSDNELPKFSLKNNVFYELYGDVKYNKFNRCLVFYPKEIVDISSELLEIDDCENTRVELHAHTNYSEMDGVSSVKEMVDTAYKMGLSGIAITDHMAIQGFPSAQNAFNNILKNNPDTSFKLIYGVEMNVIDDKLSNLINFTSDMKITELKYVIFDLETTGLSAINDEIIEFGGIKVENGSIVERLQLFIKPKKEISDFITKLTNISNEMVVDSLDFSDAAQQIIDFIGDYTLIAHNASFDFNFLNQALANINIKELNNNVIDTLAFTKNVVTTAKYYSLGKVAKHFGIKYDEDTAHRADYDCEVLNEVFNHLLVQLKNLNITTLQELDNYCSNDFYARSFKTHSTILVKNSEGLKSLFELVSLSNTVYLADSKTAEPRITKSEINRLRDNLLVGTSCQNNEIFDLAINGRDNQLKKAMEFYDYVEIQPLWAYQPIIYRKSVSDETAIIKAIKRIIKFAQSAGKIIVATGDVHYAFKHQKIFRDIIISAAGIGGIRHPLYYFNDELRKNAVHPDSYLLTTNMIKDGYRYLDKTFVEEIVVKNTNLIASMIERVYPIKDKLYPPKIENDAEILKEMAYSNAKKQYGNPLPKIVDNRIKRELDSIIGNGFQVVYYISHLLVKKSLDDGFLVGSRGSVGSSLVATMTNITEVNPLTPHYYCPKCQYSEFVENSEIRSGYDLPDKACPNCSTKLVGDGQDIPFETFLGFKGDKVPDIDLNFSSLYQEQAHEFTREIFNEKNLFRAGTISTVANKTAYGYVLGYFEDKGIKANRMYSNYLASNVEGVKRTTSQHPGGIIVVPNDMSVYDFTPVQFPANDIRSSWKTTHFAFADIHDNLLKLDLLGHVDPTAMYMLKNSSGVDPVSLPMNDKKVISLFSSTEALNIDDQHYTQDTGALGLPEFGTEFVRKMLEVTRPASFEELVIISGISHGTGNWRDNADKLIGNNIASLREVIGCRDDIMLHLIENGLDSKTAFDIMESVRKGKGVSSEWQQEMINHGIKQWYLDSAKKIAYLFPKAHAVAYSLMCVRVAWYKVYMPIHYYACFFSIRCDAYDIDTMIAGKNSILAKIIDIRERLDDVNLKMEVSTKEQNLINVLEVAYEMYCRGLSFANISIEKSQATEFIVNPENELEIIPPFTSIDGLGENIANKIVLNREERVYNSIKDFKDRSGINGTTLKKLQNLNCLVNLPEDDQLTIFSI